MQPIAANIHTCTIIAESYWNDTGLDVDANATYRCTATGNWTDWTIETNANGFNKWYLRLAGLFKRVPGANYFALTASINQQKPFLVLGTKWEGKFPSSGRLHCFANDVPGFYGNNKGKIELTIERIS